MATSEPAPWERPDPRVEALERAYGRSLFDPTAPVPIEDSTPEIPDNVRARHNAEPTDT